MCYCSVYVPLPSLSNRKLMLTKSLGSFLPSQIEQKEELLQQLAEETDGYSGSDLHTLSKEILMKPIRKFIHRLEEEGGGEGEEAKGKKAKSSSSSRPSLITPTFQHSEQEMLRVCFSTHLSIYLSFLCAF